MTCEDRRNDGTLSDFLEASRGEKGADGNVAFESLTPGQQASLVGPHGPQGVGLDIKHTFSDYNTMIDSLENPSYSYKDGNLVYVEEKSIFSTVLDFDYYVSPDGSDITGDGTIENPWLTLKKCKIYSKVGLLPGVYDDRISAYQATVLNEYASVHGLFKGMFTEPLDPLEYPDILMPEPIKSLDSSWSTKLNNTSYFTVIAAVYGPNTVTIKMGTTAQRDYSIINDLSGNLRLIVRDITVEADRKKVNNYSASWARNNQNHLLFLNCVFKEATGYSLSYANTNAILYINCA